MTTVLKYTCAGCDSTFTRQRKIKKCPLCQSLEISLVGEPKVPKKTTKKTITKIPEKKAGAEVKWTGNLWKDDGSVPREDPKFAASFYSNTKSAKRGKRA